MYKLIKNSTLILRIADNTTIPNDKENSDYKGYSDWLNEGNQPQPANQPTLEELKSQKNAEINKARLEANQTTFTHSGKLFACDQLSRSDIDAINGYVGTRNALPASWLGGWKAVDNTIVAIADVTSWNAFYDSMIEQGQQNFVKSQSLKASLDFVFSRIDLSNDEKCQSILAIAW